MRLQEHILGHLLGHKYDGDERRFTKAERNQVYFRPQRIYWHQALHVNFTTYDVRRSQDSLNPRTDHCDIMVHAREDPSSRDYHPYWYARIIKIFHVYASRAEPDGALGSPELMEVLWVRWFGKDSTYCAGPEAQCLDHVGFVTDDDDTEPFGFLDPRYVIRGCHLIPTFAHGRTNELLGPSIARGDPTETEDWRYYYIDR